MEDRDQKIRKFLGINAVNDFVDRLNEREEVIVYAVGGMARMAKRGERKAIPLPTDEEYKNSYHAPYDLSKG